MKIACIGNITYDLTVSDDKFIKEGVRSSFFDSTFTVGGPASNAASVISKFNREGVNSIDFYGQIGNDVNGKFIYGELSKENINMDNINISSNIITPFSFIIINRSDNTRTICSLRTKQDYEHPSIEKIKYKNNYDYILTDGKYADNTIELIKQNPSATTIIDAGRVNDGVLKLCHMVDYIICSDEFASTVTGIPMDDEKNDIIVLSKMQEIFKGAKEIAITVGARGYICEENNQIVVNPAFNSGKMVVDTNAAGDIFHGAFTHALASGYDYNDSLRFANITASLSTTKVGGRHSCPDLEEVEKWFDGPSKTLSR